jgi:hypothetical protein
MKPGYKAKLKTAGKKLSAAWGLNGPSLQKAAK